MVLFESINSFVIEIIYAVSVQTLDSFTIHVRKLSHGRRYVAGDTSTVLVNNTVVKQHR